MTHNPKEKIKEPYIKPEWVREELIEQFQLACGKNKVNKKKNQCACFLTKQS